MILILGLVQDTASTQYEQAKQYSNQCRSQVFHYLQKGNMDSVKYWTNEGLHYLTRNNVTDQTLIGKQHNFAAYVHGTIGNRSNAIAHYDSAINSFSQLDTLPADILYSYRKKGIEYQLLGDFYRAKVSMEMALVCSKKLHNLQLSEIETELGTISRNIGSFMEAESHYKSVLARDSISENLRTVCQANLSDLYLDLDRIKLAKSLWDKLENRLGPDIKHNPLYPDLLKIKSNILLKQGRNKQAIATLKQAMNLLGENPQSARTLNKYRCDLIELLLVQSPEKALTEAEKVLSFFAKYDKDSKDPYSMVAPHLMAKVYFALFNRSGMLNDLKKCHSYCRKAQKASDLLRQNFLYRNSKYILAEYLKENTRLGIDCGNSLISIGDTHNGTEAVFYFMEKGKSQILLDELEEKRRIGLQSKGVLEQVYALEVKKYECSDSLERILIDQEIEKIKGETKQSLVSSNGALPQPDLNQIKSLSTSNGVTYMEFGEGQRHPYLLIVNNGQARVKKLEITTNSLKQVVQNHLGNLKQPSTPPNQFIESALELYQHFLGQLDSSQKELVIIPSELVAHLPFGSLVKSDKGSGSYKKFDYAINQYNFSYLFSSAFINANDNHKTKQNFCGLLPLNQEVGDLSTHEKLIKLISKEYSGAYFQDETIGNLNDFSKAFDFMHISSHGHFDPNNPAKSYVYMPGSDSALLTIHRLYSSNLNGSPFAVLNACEMGEGETKSGEGILNFTRAFFYSGATGVIESSWKINANSTATIFEQFYTNMQQGATTSQALRNAQLAYLNNQNIDNQFAHPYYWDAFRHFGNPVRLKKAISIKTILLSSLIGLVTIFIIVWYWKRKRIQPIS